MCEETTSEMRLGDTIEEYIFLIFKYQKFDKKVDYFHVSEDVEEEEAKTQRSGIEPEDIVTLHASTPKESGKKHHRNSGSNDVRLHLETKYEMCTVVEESNEDDLDDSPERRALSLSRKEKDSLDGSVRSNPNTKEINTAFSVSSGTNSSPIEGTKKIPLSKKPKVKLFASPDDQYDKESNDKLEQAEAEQIINEQALLFESQSPLLRPLDREIFEKQHPSHPIKEKYIDDMPGQAIKTAEDPTNDMQQMEATSKNNELILIAPAPVYIESEVASPTLSRESLQKKEENSDEIYMINQMDMSKTKEQMLHTDNWLHLEAKLVSKIDIPHTFPESHPLDKLLNAALRSSGVKLPQIPSVTENVKTQASNTKTQTQHQSLIGLGTTLSAKSSLSTKPAKTPSRTPTQPPQEINSLGVVSNSIAYTSQLYTPEDSPVRRDSVIKIEALEEGPEVSPGLQHQDSNVRILEKLESKIIKILKETKMQLEAKKNARGTTNSSVTTHRKSPIPRKEGDIIAPTASAKKRSGYLASSQDKYQQIITEASSRKSAPRRQVLGTLPKPATHNILPSGNLSFELTTGTSHEKIGYRKPKMVQILNNMESYSARGPEEKTVSKVTISTTKKTKEQTKYLSGTVKHAPITATVREVEKNNISLSFNLDFSKYINTTGTFKKVPGRTSLKEKDSDTRHKMDYLPQTRLNSRNYKNRESGAGLSPSERSVSKDSLKQSAEKYTRSYGLNELNGSGRLKNLLDKFKNVAPAVPKAHASTAVKEKLSDRRSEHRNSEGHVNPVNVTATKKQSSNIMNTSSKPNDQLLKKRENTKSREGPGKHNQPSEQNKQESSKLGMLSRMQNKLRSTLLNS